MKYSKLLINSFIIVLIGFGNIYGIEITDLKCNFKSNPVGIDPNPRFSWILNSNIRNRFQTAYYLLLSDDSLLLNENIGNIWDTKKVISEESINILYSGSALEPGKEYFWKVKVWDNNGKESEWSSPARFITGLFDREDWCGAQWIGYEEIQDSLILVPGVHPWGNDVKNLALRRAVVPLFRKEFRTDREIKSAYLFVSGLGHYKAYINGQNVSDDFLSPGWTDYQKTCLHNTIDIKEYLLKGDNAIGVIVGNGFHNNNNERYRKLLITYGMPKMIALINITYEDGSSENIVSGKEWKTTPSPVIYSSIYGGEDYDARLEQPGWDMPGFNDQNWQSVLIVKDPGGILAPEITCPVRVMEVFIPAKIYKTGVDTLVYDFGQNASGIIKVKVKGRKGQKIRFVPGELINSDKSINQRATGNPFYFEYTLKGDSTEVWQPMFTYYGFRYVQVEGATVEYDSMIDSKPEILELKLLHTYNSTSRIGKFSCSGELFNSINKLILYAIQSNLQSVITDCPHREKLGWLEQTYLMGGSVHYNFDIYNLSKKLVNDIMDSQTSEGLIPCIAPEFVLFNGGFRDSPEWGSAGIILPWLIYKWYGDKSVMAGAWPVMLKYIEYLGSKADNHILSHGLGDWYDLGPGRPGVAQLTPGELTATAIYYYDVNLMALMAAILNRTGDRHRFIELADEIKNAFNSKFYNTETKIYSTGSQTAMAMPLCVGLVNEEDREQVFNNLIDIINKNGKALTAGDIGFHFLVEVLTQGGASELVYEMNNRDDVPGYGYQIKKGATALAESWAALESASNNHLMLGHIMEWFYKGLCGIHQEESSAAYKRIIINPSLAGDITEAKAEYNSPYGIIKSKWKRNTSALMLNITIPVNTTARIYIPATDIDNVFESRKPLKDVEDIKIETVENDRLIIEAGSGNYRFEVKRGQTKAFQNMVSDTVMQKIYKEIKTPYKYGLVLIPPDSTKKTDCPTVFRYEGRWYMTYIVFDGRGYETWLAESNDLLNWETLGRIMSFTDSTNWDGDQKAGYPALRDYRWGGSYELERYDNKYWMSYFGGSTRGYERGLLSTGIAYTDKNPATVHEWQRLDKPVLMATDTNVRWWENNTIYKSSVIHDKSLATGYPFVMFYNARGDSLRPHRGAERIGMAVSGNMTSWIRFGMDPVINHHRGISGDAVIQKIGDVWVMFYFGAFWSGRKDVQAFNRFACSYDLVNWTDWGGEDLIAPSEHYDKRFAHKSSVVKYKDVVYHFYCAVNRNDDRGIAVATSKDLGKSELDFSSLYSSGQSRIIKDFNFNWKFYKGDVSLASEVSYDDSKWRNLNLPHDWSIEGEFSKDNPATTAGGALPTGTGWYRKTFTLSPEYKDKSVYIDFNGVYRNSEVWINGHYLGKRPNGYISFRYDLTAHLKFGEDKNVIAVRVDNSLQPNSRWYTGSGIYRNVKLVITGKVHTDYRGTFVTTREISAEEAKVNLSVRLCNRNITPENVSVKTIILDQDNRKVTNEEINSFIMQDSLAEIKQVFIVNDPVLWSVEKPYLYTAVTKIYTDKEISDSYETVFGIRYFKFDSTKGFSLNGKPLKILGVCKHHDLGALGAAVNKRAIERRLEILKQMGCNAIRTAHNPPSPELLNLCDKKGLLVIDEAFDVWRKKKVKYDYHTDWKEWHRRDLQDMVKRDRNHPSVIIWSIGNEIREQFDSTGIAITRELVNIIRELDTTRPVTCALTENIPEKNFIYRSGSLDILGFNYKHETYAYFPETYPGEILVATENMSSLATRGHYDMPSDSIRRWPKANNIQFTGNPDFTVSAYDHISAYWGSTHEETWKVIKEHDFISGVFVWTGFDYLGEPTPYPWPARSSYFGIVDLAGFPKDVYYMYQSEWTDKPVLHILPHWNWKAGETVDVWAYFNNADEVELYLNGKSLGVKKKVNDDLHVMWRIKYRSGTLKAVSRRNGKTVLEREVRTAGKPASIELIADRTEINSGGYDLAFVTVRIVDENGILVPDADNMITFDITGEATIAGVDNGYQASSEPFKANFRKAYNGMCLVIVQSAKREGKISLNASSEGLQPAGIKINSK